MAFELTLKKAPVTIRLRAYSIFISWSTDVPDNVLNEWDETLAKYNLTSVPEKTRNRRETIELEPGQPEQVAQQLQQQLKEKYGIDAEIVGWHKQIQLPALPKED